MNLQSALLTELVICETVSKEFWIISTEGSHFKKYKTYSAQATKLLRLGFCHVT